MADEQALVEFEQPVRLQPMDAERAPEVICNFTGDAEEQWRMTAEAMGPSCEQGEKIIDQTFPLVYWLCHEATVNNEDGGVSNQVRTVLIDANGNAYGFMSNGVYKSLRQLVNFMGPGPYDPPLNIVVKSRSAGKRRFYAIEPAPKRMTAPDKKSA